MKKFILLFYLFLFVSCSQQNDKEQKITLTGKVRIDEEGGRWITGDKAVFYIDSERLEVEGNVRSGIKLD